MKPSHVQTVAMSLQKNIDFLKLQRLSFSNLYNREFNETCKAVTNEDTVTVLVADNTPITEFYQLQTNMMPLKFSGLKWHCSSG